MKVHQKLLMTLMLLAIPTFSRAQPVPLLIDAGYLSKHLHDRDLVLVEVGSKTTYDSGHIQGARFIPLEDFTASMNRQPSELSFELPPADTLRSRLAAYGISGDSHIVVYSSKGSNLPLTTRMIFTLQYLGLGDRTSFLNGGTVGWIDAGKSLTNAATSIVPGKLLAGPTKNIIADAGLVKSIPNQSNVKLVDARSPAFYRGVEPSYSKNGHIPGAVNIPFSDIADADTNIDINKLRKTFLDAGIKPGDTVVTYCHIGAQATATLFGARLLGNPVMLYDGSFQDWATNNRGDVVK
jgi:thiosulfate/3-mercaptopyruvate sulfurtransferase